MTQPDPNKPQPALHTGRLGNGTKAQTLNPRGPSEARINPDEVQNAFGHQQPPQK